MDIVRNDGPHGSLGQEFSKSIASLIASSRSALLIDPRFDLSVQRALLDGIQGSANRLGILWIASSGTTRAREELPHLIALSWRACLSSAEAVNDHLEANHSDTWLLALPDFHVGGFSIRIRAACNGAQVVATSGNVSAWDPSTFYGDLLGARATLVSLVPAQVFDLVARGYRCPSSVRAVVVGGQGLSFALYERARALGWPLLPSYGMTETCSQVATARFDSLKHSSLPTLAILPHMHVKQDHDGILHISSPALLEGILERKHGAWLFYDPRVAGVLQTKDRGFVRGGILFPQGRVGDQLKIGGEMVDRAALDRLLEEVRIETCDLSAGAPCDMALVIEEDERLGAVVTLRTTNEESGLRVEQEFNRRVVPAGRIRRRILVSTIERDALGKRARGHGDHRVSNAAK